MFVGGRPGLAVGRLPELDQIVGAGGSQLLPIGANCQCRQIPTRGAERLVPQGLGLRGARAQSIVVHAAASLIGSGLLAVCDAAVNGLVRPSRAGLLASIRIQADGHTSSRLAIGPTAGRTTRLRMDPLTLDVFEGVLRASAGAGLSRLTIRRLFDASGGNPFYGLELARALQRADAEPSPEEPLPVPAGLHGVLSARLDALPADARDALLVASCLRSPRTDTRIFCVVRPGAKTSTPEAAV